MNYKLIEDKNGTIISKGKRYRMNKLEYTKDDLIDLQNDYDLLYNKLDHYNKIINTQALEIARLKEDKRKAKEYIKNNLIQNDITRQDYEEKIKKLLEILGDKDE